MTNLISTLRKLLSEDRFNRIRKIVEMRIRYFKEIGRSSIKRIFIELSFCILTANYRVDKAIRIQNIVWDGFLYLNMRELRKILKELGYRYPNSRASYIVDARSNIDRIKDILYSSISTKKKRMMLRNLVKGFGMKESSHFLRNIGYDNVAIIDRHVLSILHRYGYIEKENYLSTKKYLQIEETLEKISTEVGISLSRLDLYLWFLKTGRIMK